MMPPARNDMVAEMRLIPGEGNGMGLLVAGLVAGVLVGFAWLAPSQGHWQSCMFQWRGCFDDVATNRPPEPLRATVSSDSSKAPPKAHAEPHKAAKAAKPSKQVSAKSRKRVAHVKEAVPPAKIVVSAHSHRPEEASDLVLNKAKAAIAAKLENPASAEFSDVDRALRKNTFGRPIDTVCGHVRGKTASGGDTGERPFLYLVKEDDAYVVDGKPNSAAAIAYRNICN